MGTTKLLAFLLVPAYVVLIAVLDTLQIQAVFDPPLLLLVLNTLLLGIVPVAVAYIAARIYLKTGSSSILLTGCGMLVFGLCTIPAAWVIGMPGGPNMTVTIHNTGSLVGAFFLALGSISNLFGRTSPDQLEKGKQTIATAYGCVCIFVVTYTFATVKGLVPSFFVQDVGPTLLRQMVLATAVIFFVLSSAFSMHTYAKWKMDFLYWYSLGLILIGIGLCAVFLQTAVGSPIGWLGRSAQYLGGIFSLVAIVTAWRSARYKRLPIERVIANFLADAEASYRDLVESARDAIISFDQDGRIISWNPAAEAMFGHTKGDAVGSPFFELLVAERHFSLLSEEMQRVTTRPTELLREKHPEIEGKRRDGSLFPMEVSISVRDLPIGRVTTCIMRDVTERKRADEILTENEKAYRTLSENIPGIVYRVHLDEPVGMAFFNNMVQSITGFTENELRVGEVCSIDPLILPDDKERVVRTVKEAIHGQSPFEVEYCITDKAGAVRYLLEYGRPVLGEQGAPPYIDGVIFDITDRKQIEKALKESETRYRSLIETASDAIFLIEEEHFVECNSRTLEIYGCTRDQILGQKPSRFSPAKQPDGRNSDEKASELIDAALKGEPQLFEWRHMRLDGSVFDVEVSLNRVDFEGRECLFAVVRDITERKLAAEALVNNEKRYRQLVENASDIIYSTDINGSFTFVNPVGLKSSGYSPEEIIGTSFLQIVPEEYRQAVQRFYEEQIVQKIPDTYGEFPFVTKQGNILWLGQKVQLIVEGDRVSGFQAIARDITDRKRAEEALRLSEEKYRLLVDKAPIGICSVDREGRILEVNQKLLEILGSPSADATKALNMLSFPPLVTSGVSGVFLNCLEHGTYQSAEIPYTTKWGKTVYLRILVTPLLEGSDNVRGCQAVMEDVSERKRAEKALQQSEERFRQVAESAGDWIWEVDQDGLYRYCSSAAERIFGYSVDELVGKKHFYELFHPAVQKELKEAAFAAFKNNEPIRNFVNPNVRKDGEIVIVETSAAPILDDHGNLLGYRGTDTDITDRKKAEEELSKSEALLNSIIEQSPFSMFICDRDGTLIKINPACKKWVRVTDEDVVGKYNLLKDEAIDTQGLIPLVRRVFENGEQANFELEWDSTLIKHLGHKEAFKLMLSVTIFPVKDTEGRITNAVCQHVDITERKQIEQSLVASEAKYRSIFDNSIEGIFQSTPDGRLVSVNPAYARMFGYGSPEEMVREVTDIGSQLYANPGDRERVLRRFNDPVLLTNYEIECRRKDGTHFWVAMDGRAVRDERGEIIYYEGLAEDITARRKTEEALRRSESLLREAQRVAHIGHWEIDSPTGTPEWSEEIFHIFGLDPARSEPSFSAHQDIIHPDDWDLLQNSVSRGTTQGIPFDIEFRCIRPDKSIRWMNAMGYPTGKRQGEFFGMFGTAQDITERKEAQEALRESEEHYRAVFENAGIGIDLVDSDGRILQSNQALLDMLGYAEEELCQLTVLDISHPDDREISKRNLESLTAGEIDRYRLEKRYVRKDGSIFWGNQTTSSIRDASGKHAGTVGVIEDITDRKQAEQASKASETRYRRLFEAAKDGILILDSGTAKIVDVNPFLIDLLGYSREELVEKKLWDIGIIEDIGTCQALFVELQGKEYVSYADLPLQKKGGSNVEVEFVSNVYLVNGNKVIQCNIRDITDRKRLEKQLLQAQKMEAVGTLAGGVAHDFNNILQVVLGYSELVLADEDLPDRLKDDLGKVVLAGRNGADLVQRLLTFSRKAEANPLDLDLNQRIRQTHKFLQRTIPKMIDIELILADDLARIHGDPTQVDQVLMNLAVNARDAMPEGGKLVIETATVFLDEECEKALLAAKPGEYVLLSVSDTGHGMDKETLDHIFEPFFTTKEAGKGTGLGLAMVYGIVHQHGGHITCYSEPGDGTTFKMYFPAIEMELKPDVAATGIMPAFGTETILLVDDEEFVRELGVRILSKHGYTVLKAADGREALDIFGKERSRISLVILDLIMPQMGGKECLKEILRIDPQVKVLVASGYSADASIRETIQMGAKGFVDKPFRVNELLRGVRRVLDEG